MRIALKFEETSIKKFIWIVLFFSLLFIYLINNKFSSELNRPDVISWATFENYDIGAVLNHLNFIAISFAVLLISGTFLLSFLYKKYDYIKELCYFLNPLSGLLIVLLAFQFVDTKSISHFYYYFLWIIPFILFYSLFRKRFIENREQSLYYFLVLLAISFSLGSLFANVNLVGPLFLIVFIVILKVLPGKFYNHFYKLIPSLKPLFFIIYIPVIAIEFSRILQDRGINIASAIVPYTALFAILILLMVFLIIKNTKNEKPVFIKKEFYYFIVPVLLTGISLRAIYYPYIENSTDIFELANQANAIVNSVVFGQIPFVDYLSSHALSNTLFGFIYVLFHGFNWTTDFMTYFYFFMPVYHLVSYLLFVKIFGKNPISIFLTLLFPYLGLLVSVKFFVALFQLFILYSLFKEFTIKKLIALFIITIIGVLWKFDIGLPMLLITIVSVIICIVRTWNDRTLGKILTVSGIFVGVFLLLALFFYFRSPDSFISNFKQAIGYLTCNQAHARIDYHSGNLRVDFFHYTLFPLIGIAIACILLFRKKFFFNKRNLFISLSILFFIAIYLLNFQRGVVRHSLNEGGDAFTTIFIYLAIALFVYIYIREKSYGKIVFFLIATFLCFNFRYKDIKGFNSLMVNYEKNQRLTKLKPSEEISRTQLFGDLKSFADNNFDQDATFIDLSNSPMLYFYLQKKVPSYFCQYMQNTVTFDLQEENIKLLDQMNVPFVVFSHRPPTWFDKTDGVPNTLRYYVITKYIYEKYKPYYIIDNFEIWIDKNLNLEKPNVPYSEITDLEFNDNLILYPYLLSLDKAYFPDKDIQYFETSNYYRNTMQVVEPINGETTYIYVKAPPIRNDATAFLEFYSEENKSGYIMFRLNKSDSEKEYLIPVDYIYQIYNKKTDSFSISVYDDVFYEDNNFVYTIYRK